MRDSIGLNSSLEPLDAQLMWLGVRRGQTRLVWNFQLDISDEHYYDFTVDAQTGQVWTRFDWVADAEYRVYEQPVESPNHSSPSAPADGRSLQVNADDSTASPFGWHDTNGAAGAEYTTPRGNNAHAYQDGILSDFEPDCGGGLSCDFTADLTQEPSAYMSAAVVNLFYWNNIIHDIQYQYGFDEAGGNFQVNNYGNGGSAGDDVRAEAQDWGGNCNANFFTPSDGNRPRMQMYLCDLASPMRDGDFDNAVIVHEYGHGISRRLIGGPNNVSCLGNQQQAGEGWSDWLGLAYTAEAGDAGADARGMGTYLFGQGAGGAGIRPAPYSTDMAVNSYMYEDIGGLAIPHGVGFVWATIAWDAYWELVDFHGFSANLYDAAGGAGNQRMMLYVNEGLKNTACSPTFLDARDGIIQAAVDNHGGADLCRLWNAFARRGLGVDAATGGTNGSARNGFNVPSECGTCVPTTEICSDTIDNDCDGAIDCADSDCDSLPAESACFDGIDNDCDTAVDCADSDCAGGSETSCSDGVDNDCDLQPDCADSDCGGDPACSASCSLGQQGETCSTDGDCCSNKCRGGGNNRSCKAGETACTPTDTVETSCSGGVDEDCDGLTDCADTDDCGTDSLCLSCAEVTEPCFEDVDCCSNNCSRGRKADRVCLVP